MKVMMLRTPHFENIFRRRSISATAQERALEASRHSVTTGTYKCGMPS